MKKINAGYWCVAGTCPNFILNKRKVMSAFHAFTVRLITHYFISVYTSTMENCYQRKLLHDFFPFPWRGRCNIRVINVTTLSRLHLLWWFISSSLWSMSIMEYIADTSLILKSAAECFDFNFSIATVVSFILWQCLSRWSRPLMKHLFTSLIRGEHIPLYLPCY